MLKSDFRPIFFPLALAFTTLAPGAGCTVGRAVPADVRVPPELLRGSPYTAAGESARSRYIVRMTDGQRDWEIQLPEIATAYEVKVPLTGKPASPLAIDMATMTAADREILADNQASQRAKGDAAGADPDDAAEDGERGASGERKGGDGKHPGRNGRGADRKVGQGESRAAGQENPGGAAQRPPPSGQASYLLTLARVKDLYRTRHYELGLVELVELEKQYPDDEHILSMKGSLYERLGNKNLARDAWQQALTLNPFNLAVLEALQRLGK
jgi:tetratricopeptide (TPR) repeat protein